MRGSFWSTFEQQNYGSKKKHYFEKFIEELDFLELSTQAKHLRVQILYDNSLNDCQCFIISFYIVSLIKYDRIFGKNFEYDTYGIK